MVHTTFQKQYILAIVLSAKLGSYEISFPNQREYHLLRREVFTQQQYFFETDNLAPVIIDAGAYFGLTTLYFKKLYPLAHITAIEPNPDSFALLELNVGINRLENVKLMPMALDVKTGTRALFADSTGNHWLSTASFHQGAWNGEQKQERKILVPTRSLNEFLRRGVDLLKLDIEGVEQAVLMAAGESLDRVNHLIVEFHPRPEQSLLELWQFLKKHFTTITFWKNGKQVSSQKAKGLVLISATK